MPKILVVDDNEINLDVICKGLKKYGYDIVITKDGYSALKILSEQSFDLLLLDVRMPKMNGFELAQKIKELEINTPFIFLTAETESTSTVQGLKLGAEDYITKPYSFEEIHLRIQKKFFLQNKILLRDKILNIMDHNVLSPTNVIKGYLQLMTETINKTRNTMFLSEQNSTDLKIHHDDWDSFEEQMHKFINEMDSASDSLTRIARNLAEINSSLDTKLNKRLVSLQHIIKNAVALTKVGQFYCNIQEPLPDITLSIDIEKMNKVFFELFDNAVLHNNHPIPNIEINCSKANGTMIDISISDNGRGIEKKDFKNVFEEFWFGHDKLHHSRGEGIGLWICKKYISAHEGTIKVKNSEPNKGSTFTITLPISQDKVSE